MIASIKILSNTVTANSTNNNIFSAKVVYITTKSPILLTVYDTTTNTQVGSISLLGNTSVAIQKKATDVITANDASNCVCTAIAYTN